MEAGKHTDEKLDEIHRLVVALKERLEAHLIEEETLKPHLAELIDILQKSKGIILFFKFILYIVGPLSVTFYWMKEHIKW